MELKEAKELIEFCKANGVKRVKLGEFEAEIGVVIQPTTQAELEKLSQALTESIPPGDALLFAATEDLNPTLEQPNASA